MRRCVQNRGLGRSKTHTQKKALHRQLARELDELFAARLQRPRHRCTLSHTTTSTSFWSILRVVDPPCTTPLAPCAVLCLAPVLVGVLIGAWDPNGVPDLGLQADLHNYYLPPFRSCVQVR